MMKNNVNDLILVKKEEEASKQEEEENNDDYDKDEEDKKKELKRSTLRENSTVIPHDKISKFFNAEEDIFEVRVLKCHNEAITSI